MKLHEKSADLLREWVDAILFARHEVRTIERNGKARGVSSGVRLLHTTWTAAYDAKNRYGMPREIEMPDEPAQMWSTIWQHIAGTPSKAPAAEPMPEV